MFFQRSIWAISRIKIAAVILGFQSFHYALNTILKYVTKEVQNSLPTYYLIIMTNYQLLNHLFIRTYLNFRMNTTINGNTIFPCSLTFIHKLICPLNLILPPKMSPRLSYIFEVKSIFNCF